jgi:hypothetical protein
MRYLLMSTVLICLTACESEYDKCFDKQLANERERYTCYDLWQECEKASRNRAAKACQSHIKE